MPPQAQNFVFPDKFLHLMQYFLHTYKFCDNMRRNSKRRILRQKLMLFLQFSYFVL